MPTKQARRRKKPPTSITAYHAHIYYDAKTTQARAARLRRRVAQEFPRANGRWHDELVGPHPVDVPDHFSARPARLGRPWLMLNRDGLDILLHPETGDDIAITPHTPAGLALRSR